MIREGFRSIKTHSFMSFASVAVITACLVIMGALGLITWNINAMIGEMQNQNKVIAYVDEKYSEADARALQSKVDAVPNIESPEPGSTATERTMASNDPATCTPNLVAGSTCATTSANSHSLIGSASLPTRPNPTGCAANGSSIGSIGV